jgi:hypothetical protein
MQEFRGKVKGEAKSLILDSYVGYGITEAKPPGNTSVPLSHFIKLRVAALIGQDATGWAFVNAQNSEVRFFAF